MNAKSAVFALISVRSQPLRKLVDRLPYASSTVYNSVNQLEDENRVKKENGIVMVVENYENQKLSEIYIQSLTHGVDPEMLMRDTTLSVWKALENVSTIKGIRKETGLSAAYVQKILAFLKEKDLILYKKRKPIIAEHDMNHPLNKILREYLEPEIRGRAVRYPGSIPFNEIMQSPEQIEKILYEKIDESLAVKDTGFLVKGDSERITLLESVDEELTYEETFLKKLFTTEGVEEYCILMIKQGLLDYEKLMRIAEEKNMINVVGCYLDILNSIDEKLVPSSIIRLFRRHMTKSKKTFLSQEKKYGKQGWEMPFEKRWNIDLYLDRGAIMHGVRSL